MGGGRLTSVKRLSCRLGLHLWCTPPGPFWIHAYQQHVDEGTRLPDDGSRAASGRRPRRGPEA